MAQKSNFKTLYALSIAWQLGFLIAIPISGFLLLGFMGDKFFNTRPLLLILGLLVSIVITMYEVFHLFVPLLKDEREND